MPAAVIYKIHPDHPEPFKIGKVAAALREGAIFLYPTDTVYAVGCDPRNKGAVERLRIFKSELAGGDTAARHLTLLCPSLSEIATYAYVDDAAFKFIKALTPGPFTFILKATKEIPRLVLNPKRKTAGLRIPNHRICQALLRELGGLLVSSSARLPSGEDAVDRFELFDALARRLDVIIDDDEALGTTPSTVIDLTTPEFEIVREGLGMEALAAFVR